MIKKIWLPTALAGIEKLEKKLTSNIVLDYPNQGTRTLNDFMAVKDHYHAMISLLSYPMNATTLAKLSHLEAISNYAVGFNNVAIDKAQELGIPYGFTPDVLNEATADTAIALTLMCARKIKYVMNDIHHKGWQHFELLRYNGYDPRNFRIGIIGMGRIGRVFAEKAYKLWETPIYTLRRKSLDNQKFDFPIKIVDEDEFFKKVNLLSLHCPLTAKTKAMVNKEFLQRFASPLIFINTARGAIHVEGDLQWGLDSGRLLTLGLDVTDPEPMNPNNSLLQDDRAIILPHIGSATDRTRCEMTELALNNVIEVLQGRPMPHCAW